MQLKVTSGEHVTLIEILGDNGAPASAQNPISRSEYAAVEFPEASGKLAIVSGMPMSAAVMVALRYKNLFGTIAVANPREGVAEIVHSVSPDYQVGGAIPLG
jgi:hypothetical protein